MERLIAFDVETPNAYNDRMSSIGIAVIEEGKIVHTFSSLIDPETHFDAFNIALTGITPEMTEDAPTFAELWSDVGALMQSGVLAAHNAAFDMRVLSRCMRNYGIDEPRYLKYLWRCFCFGAASAFLLELLIHSSPVACGAPTDLGSSSFSVISFCLFILFMGFSGQER